MLRVGATLANKVIGHSTKQNVTQVIGSARDRKGGIVGEIMFVCTVVGIVWALAYIYKRLDG
jgi:hypothetical protein